MHHYLAIFDKGNVIGPAALTLPRAPDFLSGTAGRLFIRCRGAGGFGEEGTGSCPTSRISG
jgi:hypothetical protein